MTPADAPRVTSDERILVITTVALGQTATVRLTR